MTGDNAEVGKTMLEYKQATERLGCLLSRVHRIGCAAEKLKATAELGDIFETATTAAKALADESDIAALFRDIVETSGQANHLRDLLERQGVGHIIRPWKDS